MKRPCVKIPVLPKKWNLHRVMGLNRGDVQTARAPGLILSTTRTSAHLAMGVNLPRPSHLNFVAYRTVAVDFYDTRAQAIRAVENAAVGAGIVRRG